jgi:cell wall assembly regulator SMI1
LKLQLGRPVPASLRSLLSWHNGQVPDAAGYFEQNRRLMGCSAIAAAVKERIAVSSAGHSSDYWDPAWIPFLDDDAGNYVCLDTSRPGAPLREVILGRSNQQLLAPSLLAWLADFVAAVERGDYVEDPERGDFLRKRSAK